VTVSVFFITGLVNHPTPSHFSFFYLGDFCWCWFL